MKNLFYILLAVLLFTSCSSDDENDIEYLDNSIIAGKWYWIQATDSTVLEFKNNVSTTYTYDKYIGDLENTIQSGYYKITYDRIYYPKYPKDKGREYKLKENTLSILESGIWIDYKRIKE